MRHRRSSKWSQLLGLIVGIGAAIVATGASIANIIPGASAIVGTQCNIKGNISPNTGEKIYHLPRQEHYSETRIRMDDGEQWFCSEADARAAGWRKARV